MLFAMQAQVLPQQIQKTVLAPVMQQSIEVLLLAVTELNLSIEQELQSNPLLEINEDAPAAPEPVAKEAALYGDDLLRFSRVSLQGQHSPDDEIVEEIPIKIEFSLEENLLRQLRIELCNPFEIKIGEYFIGNLDEDGYLKTTCEEVAVALGVADRFQKPGGMFIDPGPGRASLAPKRLSCDHRGPSP